MNKKWITHYNSVLTAGLAALGFTSCNGWGGQSVEYGTPTVSYHVTGHVTDEAGNPIPGIKVKVVDPYDFDRAANGKPDSTFTDAEGKYVSKQHRSVTIDEAIVTMTDEDGDANGGTFANDTVRNKEIVKKQTKKGDGNWMMGIYELTANKKLKKTK